MARTEAITFIIPTHNREQLLHRAATSVLSQTHSDIELLILDNASTDTTENAVAQFVSADSRVRYVRHHENIGAMANLLFGMRSVRTPFFALLSDDDFVFPHFAETVLDGFRRHPAAMFSACATLEIASDRLINYAVASWERYGLFEPPEGAFALLGGRHPTTVTTLFRIETVERHGLLYEDLRLVSDLEYMLRVALREPYVISPVPGGVFTRHEISISETTDERVAEQFLAMIDRLTTDGSLDESVLVRLRVSLLKDMGQRLCQVAVKSLMRDDNLTARRALSEFRKHLPQTTMSGALEIFTSMSSVLPFSDAVMRLAARYYLDRQADRCIRRARPILAAFPDSRRYVH
jgi:glycosyltransferase involved in cell wall biosynthesis